MADPFYSYNPDEGLLGHETLKGAKASAAESVELSLDDDSGWHENTDSISYGRLIPLGVAVQTNVRESNNPDFAFLCDYELQEQPDELAQLREQLATITDAGKRAHEESERQRKILDAVSAMLGYRTGFASNSIFEHAAAVMLELRAAKLEREEAVARAEDQSKVARVHSESCDRAVERLARVVAAARALTLAIREHTQALEDGCETGERSDAVFVYSIHRELYALESILSPEAKEPTSGNVTT